jgi:SAM-dependent methyltransferase
MLYHKTTNSTYDQEFFEDISPAALQSAQVIVPILIRMLNPSSVIDVGCGIGSWLSVFKILGVRKIKGIDGDYIEHNSLIIEPDEFLSTDLRRPFFLSETYDLALCLEVAEHLPDRSAQELINSLSRLAPLILFSAAIPGQYAPGHINLQWPEYWEKLFVKDGYLMFDAIRPLIWQDQRIAWYYRQNCYLYVRKSWFEINKEINTILNKTTQNDLMLIHNNIFNIHLSLSHSIKRIPSLVIKYIKEKNHHSE